MAWHLAGKIQLKWKVIDSKMKSKPIDFIAGWLWTVKILKACREMMDFSCSTSTAHNASIEARWVISIKPQITYTEYIDSNFFLCVCHQNYSNYFCMHYVDLMLKFMLIIELAWCLHGVKILVSFSFFRFIRFCFDLDEVMPRWMVLDWDWNFKWLNMYLWCY